MALFSFYRKAISLLFILLIGQWLVTRVHAQSRLVNTIFLSGTMQMELPENFIRWSSDSLNSSQEKNRSLIETYADTVNNIWITVHNPEYHIERLSEMDAFLNRYSITIKKDPSMKYKSSGSIYLKGLLQKASFVEYFHTIKQEQSYTYVVLFSPDYKKTELASMLFFTFVCPKQNYLRNAALRKQIVQTIRPGKVPDLIKD